MDMYGGDPPHFHTNGMLGTPRVEEGAEALRGCMYRSFLSHILVAKALGAKECVDILNGYKAKFDQTRMGKY